MNSAAISEKYTFFKKNNLGSRIWELDFLRGLCILIMVFDHLMFDLMYFPYWTSNFFDVDEGIFYKFVEFATFYWTWSVRVAVREAMVWVFILLSGISCSFSRSNYKRLLKLTIFASVVTLVTWLADYTLGMDIFIAFGILHLIAASLLIYILIQKLWDNKYFVLVVGIIFIAIGINLEYFKPYHYTMNLANLFDVLTGQASHGGDSYALVPYTGIFLLGVFVGKSLYTDKCSMLPMLNKAWQKPMSFIGRNTLWIYILHQPVVLGLTVLFGILSGYKIF